MDKLYTKSETGCCPRFDPKPWQNKTKVLKNKLFLKDHVVCFLHIPLNFGQIMVKNMEKIEKANALAPKPFMLVDECSPWGSDMYIEVSKNIPNSKMVRISGTFLTKVFEGSYKSMGSWIEEMKKFAESKKKKLKKLYFFYTTCPACAKVYGKNYTVILAQI